MDTVNTSSAHRRQPPTATWQSLKRHADLLPLRPHPSYFLPYKPQHHHTHLSTRTWTSVEEQHCHHLPASPAPPRVAKEHQDRDTSYSRPTVLDDQRRMMERKAESAPTALGDTIRYVQQQCSDTFVKTEKVPVHRETTYCVPKVRSDPLLKSKIRFQMDRRSLQHRFHSMSDLSKEVSDSEHSLIRSKSSRCLAEVGHHSVPTPETYTVNCPGTKHHCHQEHKLSVPLSNAVPDPVHRSDRYMTPDAPAGCTICTAQAKSSKDVGDIYLCGRSNVSAPLDNLRRRRIGVCQRGADIHSPPSLMSVMYSNSVAGLNSPSHTVSSRSHRVFDHLDNVSSTPHCHASGNNKTGTRFSSPLHTHAFVREDKVGRQGTRLEKSKCRDIAKHREEQHTSVSSSKDNSLSLQSSPTGVVVDVVCIPSVSSVNSTIDKASDDMTPCNLGKTEAESHSSNTLMEDSRKRASSANMQTEVNQEKDLKILDVENNATDKARSQSTKRIRTRSYSIQDLGADKSELGRISQKHLEWNHDSDSPQFSAAKCEKPDSCHQQEIDVISDKSSEAQPCKCVAKSEWGFSSNKKCSHVFQYSSTSAGLSQNSRQIRRAIMEESYIVSRMTHQCDDKRERITVDVSEPDRAQMENTLLELSHQGLQQPLPLYTNNIRNMDVIRNSWGIHRKNPNNEQITTRYLGSSKLQHLPQILVQDYTFPTYLTLKACLQNEEQSSLISPYAHYQNVFQNVCQNVSSSDLFSKIHTHQQNLTGGQTGVIHSSPFYPPLVVQDLPPLNLATGLGNPSLGQDRTQTQLPGVPGPLFEGSHDRQMIADRIRDQHKAASFHQEIVHNLRSLNAAMIDSEPQPQPMLLDFREYRTPRHIHHLSDSVKGRFDSNSKETLVPLTTLKPHIITNTELLKSHSAIGRDNHHPSKNQELFWPMKSNLLKPIPQKVCPQMLRPSTIHTRKQWYDSEFMLTWAERR